MLVSPFIVVLLLLYSVRFVGAGFYAGSPIGKETGKEYYLSKSQLFSQDARTNCINFGGVLANPKNEKQTIELNLYLNQVISLEKISHEVFFIWIGLSGIFSEDGISTWSDGTPFNSKSYSNWVSEEPQSTATTCVQLWVEKNIKWDDVGCYKQNYFVCEKDHQEDNLLSEDKIEKTTTELLVLANSSSATSESLTNVLRIFDQTLHNDSVVLQEHENQMQAVRVAVDDLVMKYDILNKENINISEQYISVSIRRITSNKTVTFGDVGLPRHDGSLTTISIPKSAIQRARDQAGTTSASGDVGVASTIYRKPQSMFVEKSKLQNNKLHSNHILSKFGDGILKKGTPVLVGNVISSTVINITMKDLKESIRIESEVPKGYNSLRPKNVKPQFNYHCAYWNESSQEWLRDGCVIAEIRDSKKSNSSTIYCDCDHLTNFAILVAVDEVYVPIYITILTYIGCILSSIGLLLTAFTNLVFKQLRTKTPQQILAHVCLNMATVNILFLLGIDRTDEAQSCFIIATVLHFFILTTWFWMLFEAIFLFITLVVPYQANFLKKHVVLIGIITSYGLPALFVGITSGFIDSKKYLSFRYCWLSYQAVKHYLLVPLGVLLGVNFILFILIMYSITCQPRMFKRTTNVGQVSRSVRRAVSMTFVLGIPWVFAFFMLLSQNENIKHAMEVCFTIFNSFQGLVIFLLFCARQENVRKAWSDCFCEKRRQRCHERNMGIGKTGVRLDHFIFLMLFGHMSMSAF